MKIILQDKEGTVVGECSAIAEKNILDTLFESDIQIPYSCKMGVCGICLCNVISGGEHLIKRDVMPTDEGMCLACTAFVNNADAEGEIVLQLV